MTALCLTFDDGPSEWTYPLLDLLNEHKAKATFFVVGQRILGHENLLRRMVAHAGLSSSLILSALELTEARWGAPPDGRWITFVDADKVESPNPGYCFKRAGFVLIGFTKDRGLHVLERIAAGLPGEAASTTKGMVS